MSKVLLLTSAHDSAAEILPSLSLLDHEVRIAPAVAGSVPGHPAAPPGLAETGAPAAVLVDRRDPVRSRNCAGISGTARPCSP